MRKAPVKTKKRPRRPDRPTAPRNIIAAERQAMALELRKAGLSLREIAEKIGYASASGAQEAIQAALKSTVEAPSEEYRELELQRLDLVWQHLLPKIKKGVASAAYSAVEVSKQRARLLGLNAPKGMLVRIERPEGMTDEELLAYCLRTNTPLLPAFSDMQIALAAAAAAAAAAPTALPPTPAREGVDGDPPNNPG